MSEDAGELLSGRYRPLRRLGRGGMGVVWAARDELLQRDVALKQVRLPATLEDDEREVLLQRTRREAQSAARISSPAVMTVFDVVEAHGGTWIVLELLTCRTLEQELAERGRVPPAEAATLGLGLLAALRAAHAAGVLHRDLKPANVFLDAGPGRPVVLGDFGIARIEGDPALTASGVVIGSPQYVAPERARGEPSLPASDLWSLGATLFRAVEGRPPFSADGPLATLSAVVTGDVPRPEHAGPLAPAIEGLLRKDPRQRLTAEQVRPLLQGVAEQRREAGGAGAAGAAGAGAGAAGAAGAGAGAAGAAGAGGGAAEGPGTEQGSPAGAGGAGAAQRDTGSADGGTVRVPTSPDEAAPAEPEDTAASGSATAQREPVAIQQPVPPPARQPPPEPARRSASEPQPEPAGAAQRVPEPASAPPTGADPPPSRRRPMLLAAGAVAAALLALAGWAAWPGGEPDGGAAPQPTASATADPAPTGSAGSSPDPSDGAAEQASPSSSTDAADGSTSSPGTGSDALPAGFERYSDPTGFSVAVPEGWQVEQDGPRVRLEDPDSSRYLMVDQTDDPKDDPYADWQRQEPVVADRLDGYELIGIERVDSPYGEAADWEFRHGSGGQVHVLNRNLLVSDDQAYALYWSAPDDDWSDQREVFATIADTFRPADG